MRSRALFFTTLLVGFAAFLVGRATRGRSAPPPVAAASSAEAQPQGSPDASAPATDAGASPPPTVVMMPSTLPAPERDLAAVREMIREGSPGTYLPEVIAEENGMLTRWPDRQLDALRVWIDRAPNVPDWNPQYPLVAERAFDEWRRAGFPVRFDMVRDSASADIHIRWVTSIQDSSLRNPIGRARKTRDAHGWIVAGLIEIATHGPSGRPIPAAIVAGTARHEVGHILGLGHSPNPGDVMYPESRTPEISRADRATLHLLYRLPPGPVR